MQWIVQDNVKSSHRHRETVAHEFDRGSSPQGFTGDGLFIVRLSDLIANDHTHDGPFELDSQPNAKAAAG